MAVLVDRGFDPVAVAGKTAVVAIVVAFLSWLSFSYTRLPGEFAALWLASGFLAGVLLGSPWSHWPPLAIASLAGNMLARTLVGDPWVAALGLSFAATLEAYVVAGAVRHYAGNAADPLKVRAAGRIAFLSTLGACAASGLLAALVAGDFRPTRFVLNFGMWFTAHTLGIVIFATFTFMAISLGRRLLPRPGERLEQALTYLLVVVVGVAVFQQDRYPLLFLIYPPLMISAFRHRLAGVVISSTIVTVIAMAETLAGNGPLYLTPGAGQVERLLLLQVFIGTTCLLTYPVATALTERRYLASSLRANQQRLLAITDNLPAIVTHVDTDRKFTFANAYMGRIMGFDPATIIGKSMAEVLGEAVYAEVGLRVAMALQGQGVTFETKRVFQDIHYDFETVYIPDVDVSGKVVGVYVLLFDITRLKNAEKELVSLATHDNLTGLPNRLCLGEHLHAVIARQRRHLRPLALFFMDIDRFKEVNDRFGHAQGDLVLRRFAATLKGTLRETDFIARIGGDEFVVVLDEVASADIAQLVARKILAALAPATPATSNELAVTTSIGVAYCDRAAPSADELIRVADDAMYQAKAAGRNRVHVSVL